MYAQGQMMKPTYDHCKQHKYYYVRLTHSDGTTTDGIITDVTRDQVKMLISEDVNTGPSDQRQFGFYRPFGFRRFRPGFFPLAGLASLALLPFIAPPYPYYSPYYGPYPYYY
ncbi:hypothetical protein EQV77_15880 [Halobacillus fulvus]|nr:hypothetical protein EQV77_15880 [Halobacillus fulvus]